MESLQRTADALDSRRSSSATPGARAEQAVGDLNQLALMAMAGAQAPGPVGEGQSGQDMVEQLGQLAQRQGELVSQTGELVPMRLGERLSDSRCKTFLISNRWWPVIWVS